MKNKVQVNLKTKAQRKKIGFGYPVKMFKLTVLRLAFFMGYE